MGSAAPPPMPVRRSHALGSRAQRQRLHHHCRIARPLPRRAAPRTWFACGAHTKITGPVGGMWVVAPRTRTSRNSRYRMKRKNQRMAAYTSAGGGGGGGGWACGCCCDREWRWEGAAGAPAWVAPGPGAGGVGAVLDMLLPLSLCQLPHCRWLLQGVAESQPGPRCGGRSAVQPRRGEEARRPAINEGNPRAVAHSKRSSGPVVHGTRLLTALAW